MYTQIRSVVASEFDAVNEFIISQLHSNVALVENIGHYIVDAGGKRMRPALVLLSARSCGFSGQSSVQLAAVIEFIHTATLLHDDVVDMSAMRRGRPTANAQWNNPSSVLVGDFIYSRAFQIMVGMGNMQIMKIMADTTNTIAEGEVLQLLNKHQASTSQADYMTVIRNKTAILFQAAAQCGAILANAPLEWQQALKEAGMHLGMAFQLVDDVLDYAGDSSKLGKNVGDDLAEGKPTLPLIYAMHNCPAAEADLIRHSVQHGAGEQLNEIIELVKNSGALEYTMRMAQAEAARAQQCLQVLPETEYRTAIQQMAEMAVARSN